MGAELIVALMTLTLMEIVLGIDNIVFISIIAGRLPAKQQSKARNLGIILSVIPRVGLLFALSWVMSLTNPLFGLLGHDFSGRDLILLGGGLFLLYKSVSEIHQKVEGHEEADGKSSNGKLIAALFEMLVVGLVFSLDSVITAIGMVNNLPVMIGAILISSVIMIIAAAAISRFIEARPTVKILALSFLMLIGVLLVAEGMQHHIDRGYVYFAMAFALVVELIQLRMEHNAGRKQKRIVCSGDKKDDDTKK